MSRYLFIIIFLGFSIACFFKAWQNTKISQKAILMDDGEGIDYSFPIKNFSSFIVSQKRKYNHSPSICFLPNSKLIAIWYAGDREGGTNMEIRLSFFDGEKWYGEKSLIKAKDLSSLTRRIGNPIIFSHPQKKNKLYVVFTSTLGGWATSYLNWMTSENTGKTWSKPKRLFLGNFANFSHLVRTKPYFLNHSYIAIPLYHEFINKFSLIATLDAKGFICATEKLSSFRHCIQPSISFFNKDAKQRIVFFRNTKIKKFGKKLLIKRKGKDDFIVSDIFNNDSSISSVDYKSKIILAFNKDAKAKNLVLAFLNKKLKAKPFYTLEKGFAKYPYLLRDKRGLHIVFSIAHSIKYHFLSQEFLEKKYNELL